jgi:hypothetical protein
MTNPNKARRAPRLSRGVVLRVDESTCEITTGDDPLTVRYAAQFPSPRTECVSPGHLVAVADALDGSAAVIWRCMTQSSWASGAI